MIIILKSVAGLDYSVGEKTISLKGGCFMNEIKDDDFNLIVRRYPSFKKAIDEGFIIVNDVKNKGKVQNAVDETLQSALTKQEKAINNNERLNGVKIKRA